MNKQRATLENEIEFDKVSIQFYKQLLAENDEYRYSSQVIKGIIKKIITIQERIRNNQKVLKLLKLTN